MEDEIKLLKKEIYNLPVEQQKALLTAITEGYGLADEINDETYSKIEEQILSLTEKYKTKIFNSLTYHLIEQPKENADNNSMKTIFALIKECMTSKKLSERQIEKEIEITQSSIYAWRIGKAKPSLDALIKLANYFNVTVDYLVGRETPAQNNAAENITLAPNINNEHLALWQQLDEEQQVEVNGIIKGMLLAKKKMEAK